MNLGRRHASRTTTVRPGDPRAGCYEQTIDWPSTETLYRTTARALGGCLSVMITGLVDRPGALSYTRLVEMSSVQPDASFGVPIVEVLASARIATTAEILRVTGRFGKSTVILVSELLDHPNARLTLGTSRAAFRREEGGPVRLDIPSAEPGPDWLAVTAISAMTLDEFVAWG